MDSTTEAKAILSECFRLERAAVDNNYADMLGDAFRIVVPDTLEGEST